MKVAGSNPATPTVRSSTQQPKGKKVASNQVSAFNKAKEMYDAANKPGADKKALASLKTQMDAARAKCPEGSIGQGIFG